jgi:hypothetical protein
VIRSQRELIEAELAGRSRVTEWVKNVNQTTTQGVWYDLTGSAGNPKAKQWFDAAPLTAAQIAQSTDGGIFHGANVSGDGYTKYLRQLRLQCVSATPLPMSVILCDYLLYYPSCEDGTTDPQTMNNSITLPRYTDGEGVQIIAVTISSRTGGQSFNITYTNQDGTTGRTTPNVRQNTAAAPGSIVTSATAVDGGGHPFIPLAEGDTGVRAIEAVTMLGSDTGFFALVLVKPLGYSMLRGIDAVYEKDFYLMNNELPILQDDAYLNLLVQPNGSLSGVALRGNLKAVWS